MIVDIHTRSSEARDFGKGLAKEGVPYKDASDIILGKYGFHVDEAKLDEVALEAFWAWRGLQNQLIRNGARIVVGVCDDEKTPDQIALENKVAEGWEDGPVTRVFRSGKTVILDPAPDAHLEADYEDRVGGLDE